MIAKIAYVSACVGLALTSALVSGCGEAADDDSEASGGSAVISTKAFTADCTLSVEKNGKIVNGFLEGDFTVEKDLSLTPGKTVYVSIGERGRKDYKLKLKSGAIVDAKNEVFEFVATQNVKAAGFTINVMDVKVRYDGQKKAADVDSVVTGKDTYNASCRFKDENGRDTTNF